MSNRIKTQADLVIEDLGGGAPQEIKIEHIKLPGLELLHTKSKQEVAEIITNVLKSQTNIVGMRWIFGTAMELYVKD